MSLKLNVVTASTRPGRIGPKIAEWFHGYAVRHGGFEPVLVDLAEFELPLYDEPEHPLTRRYHHAHTKSWSASVASADAFAFVMPEYDHSPPPALVNAFVYLYHEWNYKPAGFVSYGGVSGGLRGVQAARATAATLKMMPIPEGVPIPNVFQYLGEDGVFQAPEPVELSAKSMLDELLRWTMALKAMRQPQQAAAA